jgi:hypothetical protein
LAQVQKPYYGGFDREVVARLSLFAWGWHNEAGPEDKEKFAFRNAERLFRLQ